MPLPRLRVAGVWLCGALVAPYTSTAIVGGMLRQPPTFRATAMLRIPTRSYATAPEGLVAFIIPDLP